MSMKHGIPIKRKNEEGVGMIDILISVAIITIAFWGFSQVALLGVKVQGEAEQREGAVYLAQEAIEVARLLRDSSWSSNIAPLSIGVPYFPVVSGTEWTLSGTNPGLLNNLHTRTVTFERVYRDVNDNIAGSGTEDTNSRKIVISLTWSDKKYEIVTYLTNLLFN